MGAIAKRITKRRAYPVKAATVIAACEPVLLASGYLTPVSGGVGTCVGVAEILVDNTTGANGDIQAPVEAGEHKFANAGDVVAASVGATAYFVDASTVSIDDDTASRPAAGSITQVDADGVWVELGV